MRNKYFVNFVCTFLLFLNDIFKVMYYCINFFLCIIISDPRVKDWFLMSGPLPTMMICLSYVLIVKIIGPKFMENRKPFVLRKTLIIYNFFQVLFSTWLFYEVSLFCSFYNLAYIKYYVPVFSMAPIIKNMEYL